MMLDRKLHVLLRKGFYYSNRAILQQILALGLFPGQPKILEFLLEKDGAMAKEIGEGCVIDKSTIANLLVRMERQNLVYRKGYPSDKRASHIYLTEQGRALAKQVKAICIDVDTKAFRGIPPDEQQQFLHTLRLLITNLEEESE